MSQRRKITRREFLGLSAIATAGAVATACCPSVETPQPTAEKAAPTKAPDATKKPDTTEAPKATTEPPITYKPSPIASLCPTANI